MKKIVLICLTVLASSALADQFDDYSFPEGEPNSSLRMCYGADYNPFGFESCVNQNFQSLRQLNKNLFIGRCYNLKSNPFGYENCVNQQFRRIDMAMDTITFNCYGADYNPFGFESCINRNFRSIEK